MRYQTLRWLVVGSLGALLTCCTSLTIPADAGMIVSVSAPGVQATGVIGATTETFDSGSTSTIIGTYTSPFSVPLVLSPSDFGGAYGGASNTSYLGAYAGITTLDLNSPQKYFGMWWAAMDAANEIDFYDGANLLAAFDASDLIPLLASNYLGNPNNNQTLHEEFGYFHFVATNGDSITKVVFSNGSSSVFESDNHSVFDRAILPPGTVLVPEPTNAGLIAAIGVGAVGLRRKRENSASERPVRD